MLSFAENTFCLLKKTATNRFKTKKVNEKKQREYDDLETCNGSVTF